MNTPRVHEWSAIADGFTHGLILGNGASIAVDDRFSYVSLLEKAEQLGVLTSDLQRVFKFFNMTDFELALQVLWHAQQVNRALKIKGKRTKNAYKAVRNALIQTVTSVHAQYQQAADKLMRGVNFLSQFETVASLNYDLLVYWCFLIGNAAATNRFKDCFINGLFQQDWRFLREPYGQTGATTLVFYPHGNLAIGSDITGVEVKIQAQEFSTLLETVIAEWEAGRLAPVFVSEGASVQKERAIRRSPYLSTVYEEILPKLGETVVIYGWSFSDQDDHIIRAICKGSPRRFAVSVLRHSYRLDEFFTQVQQKIDAYSGRNRYELLFFDASSRGAWVAS